ncbi:MAG: DUF648 domain-containing protein, partial [Parachlamydiaceae bacterium]|nr:DUF648 domain-containing protein [Parachlamydiaceae bacterium]
MSNSIGFFTAVKYGENKTFSQFALEKVDNYFYLGGKKAHIIQGKKNKEYENVLLDETNTSLLSRIGKVLSYFTVILPLAMLITKAVLRSKHSFRLIDLEKKLAKGINISEETASKIRDLMSKILVGKNDDQIEWMHTDEILEFKLKENPLLVYKI